MSFVSDHLNALGRSSRQLAETPVPSLLTVLVIGVSLALPMLLVVLVQNLDQLGGGVRDGRQLSVFLQPEIDESEAVDLLVALEQRSGIRRVDMVSKGAALAELDSMAWVTDVVNAIGDNPLPITILVEPEAQFRDVENISILAKELEALSEVDQVLLDVVWLKRLDSLLALVRRATAILSCLLALAVLLTVSNTIRLMVMNRASEIEVVNRIGGTDAFIRRPFVYSGLLQGVIGAMLAVSVVFAVGIALREEVSALVAAYGSNFDLVVPGWQLVASVLAAGAGLGWLASWFAVSRHLRRLRPN